MGMAVGDALGTTYEFQELAQPAYPVLATGPATDVVGRGPFALAPGAITDDTQLAVCLARSLADRGEVDAGDVAQRYLAWSAEAFDIGTQTSAALGAFRRTGDAVRAGLIAWRSGGRRAAGNGSLMRTAPIGVALRMEFPVAVIEAAITDSLITHADPRCVLACGVFDAVIARLASDASFGASAMVAYAQEMLPLAAARLRERWHGHDPESAADLATIEPARAELARDLDAALADDPQVYGPELHVDRTSGYVRLAFRLAFWHAMHTPRWTDALVDTASRGGDADTNAAIVGALLGARDGIGAIPAAWVERVLGATQKGRAAWGEAHHPRHLLAL